MGHENQCTVERRLLNVDARNLELAELFGHKIAHWVVDFDGEKTTQTPPYHGPSGALETALRENMACMA